MAAQIFGADFFLFGMRSGKNVDPPQQLMITSYPKEWTKYYDNTGALAYDPVLQEAFKFNGPFRWEGLHKTEQQRALRRKAEQTGMTYGCSCSERGVNGAVAIMSFCGRRRIAEGPDEWTRASGAMSLLLSSAQKAASRIVEAQASNCLAGIALTDAERRCLEMMAESRTIEQIAKALNVRPRTVRYYMDRAALKLGVETPREAILKALATGLVDPRHFPDSGFQGSVE